MNQQIPDLFCLTTADYTHWNDEIVDREKLFFHFFKLEKEWEKNRDAFEMWLRFFRRQTKRRKLKGNELEQWKHAVKLFICAEQVAQNKDQFSAIMEEDYEKRLFLTNLDKSLENFSKSNDIEIKFEENENIVLCCLFANTPQKRAVEVPFATDNGQIHILEIQPIKSYGGVSRNPKKLPNIDEYAEKIEPNFHFAIKNAFEFWKTFWREHKDNEQQKLWDQLNPDIHFDTLGIIWDVKPFYAENLKQEPANYKTKSEPEVVTEAENLREKKPDKLLHGESAGLAALVGIYHAMLNKIPDSRVVYSVKLNSKDNKPTGKFSPVSKSGIPAKIEAAIETDFIDTFVMHEDNFNEEIKRIVDSNINRGKLFRIKTIDSDGIKKEI